MSDNVVAIIAIMCIFGLPVFGWIVVRTLRFLERMEMIKRGIVPPPEAPLPFGGRRAWREWGAQQTTAQWPGAMPGASRSCDPSDDPQRALFKGIRLAAVGFALTIGLSFIGLGGGEFRYGPWMLGGLIPLFVGIAQVIIALLCGAQLPGADGGRYGPPPGPPPGPGDVPPRAGAWQQPGRRPEELAKPVQPPDLR